MCLKRKNPWPSSLHHNMHCRESNPKRLTMWFYFYSHSKAWATCSQAMSSRKIEFSKRRSTADTYDVNATQCGMCYFAQNIAVEKRGIASRNRFGQRNRCRHPKFIEISRVSGRIAIRSLESPSIIAIAQRLTRMLTPFNLQTRQSPHGLPCAQTFPCQDRKVTQRPCPSAITVRSHETGNRLSHFNNAHPTDAGLAVTLGVDIITILKKSERGTLEYGFSPRAD